MIIFSLVAMTGLEKCCITSAYLQWLCHSGERPVARGPLVFITISWRIVIPGLLYLCDKMIYIQIHLGQCDLYYMVE